MCVCLGKMYLMLIPPFHGLRRDDDADPVPMIFFTPCHVVQTPFPTHSIPLLNTLFSLSCHPIFVFPIKCFYILGNCWKMVHSSVHPIKCFYILGNCYKMCPIKCFYILCSVSNVAMVSLLTLLYVLQCRHGIMADIVVCASMSPWSHG